MPLPEELLELGSRIHNWFQRPEGATDTAPYQVYVYRPDKEWAVRRDVIDLEEWLKARQVATQAISLADLLWQAIDESGWADELFSQEREARDDPAAQAEVHRAVAELLRQPKPLSQRVIEEIRWHGGAPPAVFLYRAGSLYPSFRTSGLLDDLRPKLTDVPVTLLYPGRLQGDFGLQFMDKWEPTYNYRALLVERTG